MMQSGPLIITFQKKSYYLLDQQLEISILEYYLDRKSQNFILTWNHLKSCRFGLLITEHQGQVFFFFKLKICWHQTLSHQHQFLFQILPSEFSSEMIHNYFFLFSKKFKAIFHLSLTPHQNCLFCSALNQIEEWLHRLLENREDLIHLLLPYGLMLIEIVFPESSF